jgi:hypothetical protein
MRALLLIAALLAAAAPVSAKDDCADIDRRLAATSPKQTFPPPARSTLLSHRQALKCPGTPPEYAPPKPIPPRTPSPEEKAAAEKATAAKAEADAQRNKAALEAHCRKLDEQIADPTIDPVTRVRIKILRNNSKCPGEAPKPKTAP